MIKHKSATRTADIRHHDQAPPVSLCKSCVRCDQPLEVCERFEQQTTKAQGYWIVLVCTGYQKDGHDDEAFG